MKPSELKDILEDHRFWIESDQKHGRRADLERANLRNANLRGANLRGAILYGAYLQGAYLQGAYLRGTNLMGAYLQGATFDLNFKQVGWFRGATFSQDQIPWVCLHPRYSEWADTLKWVKAITTAA